jgi:polysaccharide export outer membrane protein
VWGGLAAAFYLLVVMGCSGGLTFNAALLPDEFRVPPAPSLRGINLARLAAPRAASSRIGAGDLLDLTIATGYESDSVHTVLLRVDDRGSIQVPLIGGVPVGGLDPAEAEQLVAAQAVERSVYRQPTVTLSIRRKRSSAITVLGAVESPGTFDLPEGSSDVLGALAAAGGLTEDASVEVDIVRNSAPSAIGPGPPVPQGNGTPTGSLAAYALPSPTSAAPGALRVNLAEIAQYPPSDYRLQDGDVLMVYPEQPRFVHVLGLVRKPGQFEIPPGKDIYLLDALALAGGRTMEVADKVRVIRRVPGEPEPVVIRVSVREAKRSADVNLRLAPGDLVSVEETPATFVLDLFRSFIRFGFSASTPLF